jgi:endonuclease G
VFEFVVFVNELEKKTGIDFFLKLEDKIKAVVEKNSGYKDKSF